ncbi:MAG: DNA repair protein RecO [Gemmatimonadetes bacterium]|nr:DNA repair protein RecO [Gemmatimonadota bacterium]
MALVETVGTVLSTMPYGETSKIARLATAELGVVSVIAKGAKRPRSKFGVALASLSSGHAAIYLARQSDLHTLASFEAVTVPEALARPIERYAIATVLAEMMLHFAPHERNPDLYRFFAHALDVLAAVPVDGVAVVGLRSVWGLVGALGFAPTLDRCAKDGVAVARTGSIAFSPGHGGVLCPACSRGVDAATLQPRDLADLEALVHGRGDLPALTDRYLVAHRRLAGRYLRHHLTDGGSLPAVSLWLDPSVGSG